MQIAKSLRASPARRPTTCARRSARRTARRWRKLEPEFREGCRASGTREQLIEHLWTTNEKSADYSFNKSHAACYALIAYRTAWLKANYPAEYMAALISSVMDTKDKVPFFAAKAEEMGIEILPPDVNLSDHEFVVVEGNIRFGLDAVKGVGYRRSRRSRRRARRAGRSRRSGTSAPASTAARVNKRAIEALIKCGAFGSTGASRKGMLDGARARAGRRAEGPAGPRDRPGLDLRHGVRRRRGRRRRRGGVRGAGPPADPDRGVRPARAARGREGVDRRSSSRRTRSSRCARRCARWSTARSPSSPTARTATGSRPAASSPRRRRSARKKGDPMMFATLDDLEGVGRDPRLRQGARPSTRARSASTRSSSCAAASTTRTPTRPASSCSRSSRSSRRAEEVEKAKEAAREAHARPACRCTCRVDAAPLPASVIDELKHAARQLPRRVRRRARDARPRAGRRTLRLGPSYRVAPTPRCAPSSSTCSGPRRSPNPRPPPPRGVG